MQIFGVGILEIMLILALSILVVGPDRMPQFAADLARWIRQARAYANHLMKDFNEVVGELEKEVGASRDDWREIASVVNRHTGDVVREVQRVATQIEASANLDAPQNGVSSAAAVSGGSNGTEAVPPPLEEQAPPLQEAESAEEKPWYVPERGSRRRSSD